MGEKGPGSVVKAHGRRQGDYRTTRNTKWLETVRSLCLAGTPLQQIRAALREGGYHVPQQKTLEAYIRDGCIPGVKWDAYQAEVQRIAEREEIIKKSEHADPRFKVWRNTITAMLRNGHSLSAIERELKSRDLRPYTAEAIQKYLIDGFFYDMTPEKHQKAIVMRKTRRWEQWENCVHPLALEGYSGTEIRRKLLEKKLGPNSLTSILRYIRAGRVPGLTPAQYEQLAADRKFGEKKKWVSIVQDSLNKGDPLGVIQQKLKDAGLSKHSPKTILRMLEAGYVPGYVWDKKNNPFWNQTVYDMLYNGKSVESVHRELERMGLKPTASMTIWSRLRQGAIQKRLPDGTLSVMDEKCYEERRHCGGQVEPHSGTKSAEGRQMQAGETQKVTTPAPIYDSNI